MLEDNLDRINRFNSILEQHDGETRIVVRRTAKGFIQAHTQLNFAPTLIALDHDLFTDKPDDPDPGDGRDVAVHLAECKPNSPILIHSTNAPAAESMLLTLRDAKWTADRIAPIGDDWIESYWYPVAIELIARKTS